MDWLRPAATALALAILVAILWRFFRTPPVFEILVQNGVPSVRRGRVSGRFFAEVELICKTWSIPGGTIRGVPGPSGTRLVFSREIAAEHHQRFRNVWHLGE